MASSVDFVSELHRKLQRIFGTNPDVYVQFIYEEASSSTASSSAASSSLSQQPAFRCHVTLKQIDDERITQQLSQLGWRTDVPLCGAWCPSKKEAKQDACRSILLSLGGGGGTGESLQQSHGAASVSTTSALHSSHDIRQVRAMQGDAVLRLVMVNYVLSVRPNISPGDLANAVTSIVSNEALVKRQRDLIDRGMLPVMMPPPSGHKHQDATAVECWVADIFEVENMDMKSTARIVVSALVEGAYIHD